MWPRPGKSCFDAPPLRPSPARPSCGGLPQLPSPEKPSRTPLPMRQGPARRSREEAPQRPGPEKPFCDPLQVRPCPARRSRGGPPHRRSIQKPSRDPSPHRPGPVRPIFAPGCVREGRWDTAPGGSREGGRCGIPEVEDTPSSPGEARRGRFHQSAGDLARTFLNFAKKAQGDG